MAAELQRLFQYKALPKVLVPAWVKVPGRHRQCQRLIAPAEHPRPAAGAVLLPAGRGQSTSAPLAGGQL